MKNLCAQVDRLSKKVYIVYTMIILGYDTALEYWRRLSSHCGENNCVISRGHSAYRSEKHEICKINPPTDQPDLKMIESENAWGLVLPLDILLGKASARSRSQIVRQHVFTGQTPLGSFLCDTDGLIVSSPEFCFYQMASTLSIVELIELAFELCGSYSLPERLPLHKQEQEPAKGFCNRRPLTNLRKLKSYASKMSGVQGYRKVQRALQHVVQGAASPMESKLTMLLTLPYRFGGYGFTAPELNRCIEISRSAKVRASKKHYYCDLFWPDHQLAVEYDSNLFHTGPTRIARDSKRRNSLISLGITVITVTNQQMRNSREFEKVARQIAVCMDKRLQLKRPEFFNAHQVLRRLLLE